MASYMATRRELGFKNGASDGRALLGESRYASIISRTNSHELALAYGASHPRPDSRRGSIEVVGHAPTESPVNQLIRISSFPSNSRSPIRSDGCRLKKFAGEMVGPDLVPSSTWTVRLFLVGRGTAPPSDCILLPVGLPRQFYFILLFTAAA